MSATRMVIGQVSQSMTMGFSTRMTPPHDWRWVMSRVVSSGRPDERNARTDHRQLTDTGGYPEILRAPARGCRSARLPSPV